MESQRIIFLFRDIEAFKLPLAETVGDYLNYLESTRNAAVNTVVGYGRSLIAFVRFCHHRQIDRIEQIKPKIIFAYLRELKQQGKVGTSINRAFVPIKMLIKFAAMNGIESKYFVQIFCIPSPKITKKLPKVLTIDQVKRLIEVVPPMRCGCRFRDIAILELLYGTGIRGSELISLKLCDVDLAERFIVVLGKGAKERILPLTETVALAIQKYINTDRRSQFLSSGKSDSYLFLSRSGLPLYRHDLWRIVTRYARLAGLSNVSPHTLRHCFATHLFMNGADLLLIQKALGHSRITTTQIYTHVDISQLKKTIEKYHPRA
ncbi:Tyrosine recombinase XerD [subsurface metagenome]